MYSSFASISQDTSKSHKQLQMFASRSLQKLQAACRPVPRQSFSTLFPFSSVNATKATASSNAEQNQNKAPHFSTASESTTTTTVKPLVKSEIIQEIAKTHDLTLASSKRMLGTVLDTIMEAVVEGRPVRLKGFGMFDSYMSKERTGMNPNTQEKIIIPPKRRIRFKPYENFKTM